jgi:predicted RNase H-like HicB family nuclease
MGIRGGGQGAATWGDTREEARRQIQEVVEMVIEALLEEGTPLSEDVQVASTALDTLVAQITLESRHPETD